MKSEIIINIGLVIAISLLLALGSLFIPPDEFYFAGLATLMLPVLILLNAGLLIFALFKHSLKSIPFLIAFILSLAPIANAISIFKSPVHLLGKSLSILSYNTGALSYFNEPQSFSQYTFTFANWLNASKHDIICLQELIETDTAGLTLPSYTKLESVKKISATTKLGLFIYSKLPVVQSGEIEFAFNSYNRLMWADVTCEGCDTIRIINVHLMSYDLSSVKGWGYFSAIRTGVMARSWHAKIISDFVKQTPYPVILCGDFNEPPLSYVYRSLKNILKDSFSSSGTGFSFTFIAGLFPVRIDYIFYSETLNSADYQVIKDAPWSDHRPISVRISMPSLDE